MQTTYSENIPRGVPGFIPNMAAAILISRDAAAAIGFGLPVAQGAGDRVGRLFANGDTITDFLGVTVLDRSIREGNAYAAQESMRVMQSGPILVTAAVQVAAGDPVCVTTAGAWSNVPGTGGITLPDARWDDSTTGAGQLAQITIK